MNKYCAIVPTYNNAGTLEDVLDRLTHYLNNIIVVNDGSTDETSSILDRYKSPEGITLTVVSYLPNQGKGYALREGFRKARALGFTHAVSIDSDGQHYPEDVPLLLKSSEAKPRDIIIGARQLEHENKSKGSVFATRLGNFWFRFQTWQNISDTQSGFRVYPLDSLHGLGLLTCRYEAELELLVYAAWCGRNISETPIRVYYPPREERVSHFRPAYDFTRISILNTGLSLLSAVFGWWLMLGFKVLRF